MVNEPSRGTDQAKKSPVDFTPFARHHHSVILPSSLFFLLSPRPYLYRLYLPRLFLGLHPRHPPTVHHRIIDLTQRRAVIVNLDFSRAPSRIESSSVSLLRF